jgi:hypothetical protein
MTANKPSFQEESRVAVGGVELPEPDSSVIEPNPAEFGLPFEQRSAVAYYTTDQMLAYGEARALAERERCALIAEHLNGWGSRPCPELADHIAAAIRGE